MIEQVEKYLLNLQNDICEEFGGLDTKSSFDKDVWQREDGRGSGITRVITNGSLFEKGGVNFSIISGDKMPKSATELRPELAGRKYTALGISLVLHPENPFIPTTHANVRFFIAENEEEEPLWWFGGGFDLTPYYGFEEDAIHWHKIANKACEPFGEKVYEKYSYFLKKISDTKNFNLDASSDALLLEGDPDLKYLREVNKTYGFGTNEMSAGQKSGLIFGGLVVFFLLFLSGYLME